MDKLGERSTMHLAMPILSPSGAVEFLRQLGLASQMLSFHRMLELHHRAVLLRRWRLGFPEETFNFQAALELHSLHHRVALSIEV